MYVFILCVLRVVFFVSGVWIYDQPQNLEFRPMHVYRLPTHQRLYDRDSNIATSTSDKETKKYAWIYDLPQNLEFRPMHVYRLPTRQILYDRDSNIATSTSDKETKKYDLEQQILLKKEQILKKIFDKLWVQSQNYSATHLKPLPNWIDLLSLKESMIKAYKDIRAAPIVTVKRFDALGAAYDDAEFGRNPGVVPVREQEFLDAVVSSEMFTTVVEEIGQSDLYKHNVYMPQFNREYLNRIWYIPFQQNLYPGRGFKHVFFGDKGHGLHSWLRAAAELITHKHTDVTVLASCDQEGPDIVMVTKGVDEFSSLFVGTVPEFDMLIFSLCFWAFGGKNKCVINIAGTTVNIYVKGKVSGLGKITTAFPMCPIRNWRRVYTD